MINFLQILGNAITPLLNVNFSTNQSILVSIAVVVIVAAILSFLSKLLKQEFILAYILAGVIIGPLVLGLIKDPTIINGFAEIGITFLLFVVGLEMSLKRFRGRGGAIAVTGIVQIVTVTALTFFLLVALRFSRVESFWLGIAVALSSTVVVTKILLDKHEMSTLHARFIIGIMLIQDVVAIIALALLSKDLSFGFIGLALLKLAMLAGLAFLLGFVVRPLFKKAASSHELLFIMSLAFLFLFVALAYFMNFSITIGAFIAGVMLANTPYKVEIESKTKALGDFFSVMFFVSIGMLLTSISKALLLPLIVVLLILIFFEPFITALVLRIWGYKTRTSLQTGFAFAQISEFSLILMLAALTKGIISENAFGLIVLAAVISIAITQYTIKLESPLNKIFNSFFAFLKIPVKQEQINTDFGKKTILLVGCHRMGSIFLKNLEKYKDKVLVLDFDPDITHALSKQNVSCIYGDVGNSELLNQVPAKDFKVVISTIPRKEDNLLMIRHFKKISSHIFLMVSASRIDDALELYKEGADYVLLPMIVSAEQCVSMIKDLNKKEFYKLKKEHIKYLEDMHKFLY